jgi:uncharacterized membrane protein
MSTRALRITLIVLSTIGVGLAAYLTYVHYTGVEPPCSIKGNPCSQVQKSKYSELAGIPVALMGLIGYIAILGTLLAPENETSRLATAAIALGGFGFSMYLTYREVFTLEKICEWCVGSAALLTIIMLLSVWRFLLGSDTQPPSSPPPEDAGAQDPAPLATTS